MPKNLFGSVLLAYALPLCLLGPKVHAAAPDYLDLSLDDLLNVPITVASRKALTQRETPGVVTVIEGDYIRRSGARDLIDVLRQVPGYDFRLIVSNILGLGVRGHIGSDGRVLMLVDGVEVNEQRFGTAQFGLGFPVENIHRIEIVRGSALAMYGGTAEMGVINIVTRGASGDPADSGTEMSAARGGVEGGRTSRSQWSVSTAAKSGDLRLSAFVSGAKALRSDQIFQGLAGATYDMAEKDGIEPEYANLGLSWGKLQVRYQKENIEVKSRYAGSGIQSDAWSFTQRAEALHMSGNWDLGDAITLSPSLTFQTQSPRETRNPLGMVTSQTRVERTQGKIGFTWDAGAKWHVAGGLDALDAKYDGVVRTFPLRPLAFDRLSVAGIYSEVLRRSDWADLTWGMRRDTHQYAGNLWSHRVGLTRQWGVWHAKALASMAQRAPSVEDYSSSANGLAARKNERLANVELELGYRMDAGTQLSVNVFDILTQDTLILRNSSNVRTRGLEAVVQARRSWGQADISFSLYAPDGTDAGPVRVIDVQTGDVQDSRSLLGFSPWKLASSASWRLQPGVTLSPSVVVYGPRWGFDAPNSTAAQARLRQFPAATLANAALQWEDAGVKGLTLSAGVYNLLGTSTVFAPPIANNTPPAPDLGREWVVRARYRF